MAGTVNAWYDLVVVTWKIQSSCKEQAVAKEILVCGTCIQPVVKFEVRKVSKRSSVTEMILFHIRARVEV
jgi:hypothetical protein